MQSLLLLIALLAAPHGASQRQVQTYRYDALGRLDRLTYDGATTISYDWDGGGRIATKSVTPQPPQASGGGGGSSRCFVATAAYGSALAPEVEALREFRDTQLRQHAAGRAFIAWYERTSPPLAAWIADRPFARATARALLAPLLLAIGHPGAATASALVLLAALLLARRRYFALRSKRSG
ncbi:MAG: hypothetical protein JNL90_06125 [Planctomycetes bacterium]|nr:hypothetical protein [Planctomycetota bacterium]